MGVTHLSKMTKLEWLDLQDSQVTDAGLEALEAIPSLRGVALRGSHVTPAAVAKHKSVAARMKIVNWPTR